MKVEAPLKLCAFYLTFATYHLLRFPLKADVPQSGQIEGYGPILQQRGVRDQPPSDVVVQSFNNTASPAVTSLVFAHYLQNFFSPLP